VVDTFFQQNIGLHLGANCVLSLSIFALILEAVRHGIKENLSRHKGITEANLSFRYIDENYSVNDLPYWVA
jgi:hypothetical protein